MLKGRIAGLDVGQRRIGIAVSDLLGVTAQGLPTLKRQNRYTDLAALTKLARDYEIERWIVGLPIHMSGTESSQAQKVRRLGELLQAATGIPVEYRDERLTTVEAARVLKQAELSLEKTRQAIDRLSAVLILQGYLDQLAEEAARTRPANAGNETTEEDEDFAVE